jgi:hypothetical protein
LDFSELPPSKQWAALKYRGEKFAEVWFKPEGEPFALAFRIPRTSFQIPGMDQGLTAANLLKAVGVATEEVESWSHGDIEHSGMDGANPEFEQPFAAPPEDVSELNIYVNLKPPAEVAESDEADVPAESDATASEGDATVDDTAAASEGIAPAESCATPGEPDALNEGTAPVEVGAAVGAGGATGDSPVLWEDLESRWRTIVGVEAAIDNLRLMVEGMQAQMETAANRPLTTDEKLHATKADLASWARVKARVPFVLPKVREFIHRATWATGTPERKKLEDLFKDESPPEMPFPRLVKLSDQLENLLKDRQILSAHGVNVQQECKTVANEVLSTLRQLQSNAAANADRKRRAGRAKGKFFKDVRKLSGAD